MRWQLKRSLGLYRAVAALAVASYAGAVRGEDRYYLGSPPRADASWHSQVWSNYVVPGSGDVAIFDHTHLEPGSYLGGQAVYLGDFWHHDVEPYSVTQPGGVATVGAVLVNSGTWALNFGPNFQGPNWNGQPPARGGLNMCWLAVEGGHLTLSELGEIHTTHGKASARMQLLYVNLNGGHGILEITLQARVMVTSQSNLAWAQGSIAEATASNGAIGDTAGMMSIGLSGHGKLTIRTAATVTAGSAVLGYYETGVGEVSVDASVWTNAAGLAVGYLGAGALTIQNHGIVQSESAHLGSLASGMGNVLVDGSGATWKTTGPCTSEQAGKVTSPSAKEELQPQVVLSLATARPAWAK